jgi:hypothetical protein
MDAARDTEHDQPEAENEPVEQPAELPDVQTIVALMDKLTAMVEIITAERAAPPIRWLTIQQACHRAGCSYETMRQWRRRKWVISSDDDGPIRISEASVDECLRRLNRSPVI